MFIGEKNFDDMNIEIMKEGAVRFTNIVGFFWD